MGRPNTRRSVGRPAKTDSANSKSASENRKTKYLFSGDSPQSNNTSHVISTPSTRRSIAAHQNQNNHGTANKNSTASTRSSRKRKSNNKWDEDTDEENEPLPGKRRGVYLDTYNSSYAYDDEESGSERDEDDLDDNEDEFAGEEEDDSQQSTAVNSTGKQFPWARALRPRSPPAFHDTNLPDLCLPKCSQDLLLSETDVNQYLLQICSVYEILRHFKQQLRLSAFRIEEFIAALQLDEMNSLCSEIHITLLKVLVKEDEINSTLIGSTDVKDSVNIHLYCCDIMTWPFVLKMYLQARARGQITKSNVGDFEARRIIQKIYTTNYPLGVSLETKLLMLQYLCDSFLETSIARDEIMNIEALTIKHDDHCRKCHKLGDLLCCDNCPSVWHLSCVDPPMNTVPNNEWICHICRAMNIEEIEAASVRKEILGWDRNGRKYWWLCQRLIVEESLASNDEGESSQDVIYYYSTKRQFEELMNQLDSTKYEKELCEVLNEMKEDILHGFDVINQYTNNALRSKGLVIQNVKSWIELNSGERSGDDEIDPNALSESNASAGIVTRLKTGAIQPKSMSDTAKTTGTEHLLEDREVLYYWDADKGDTVLKRTHKKLISHLSAIPFKLGMEGRGYCNYFNINILAMNKYQQQEERDKRRQLSWKFSLTPLSEFKWVGPVNGSRITLIQTLRQTIVHLEGSLHSAFLHPNWALHRLNWLKAVQMCDNAKDFALALSILESSIKPLLFNPVWNDSIGHNLLERVTLIDREDRKKTEKRERREASEELDMLIRLGGVKYSLMPNRSKDGVWSGQGAGRGVHQLWKQKGEEYRVTGKGGWSWRSATRVQMAAPLPLEVLKVDELTKEESERVKNTYVINVMAELSKSEDEKRIYYPKRFKKESRPKLLFVESLLDRRVKLKAAIESEAQKLKEQTTPAKPKFVCWSSLCRSETKDSLTCYSYECRAQSAIRAAKESTKVEEQAEDPNQVHYCVKPVYLYKLNERNEIVRKLNGKRVLGKGQLPPCAQFCTKSQCKSIFVLPRHDLKKLSRTAGLREIRGFSYTAKYNPYIWPFGTTPRPLFRTCWLYRNSIIEKHHGIEGVALSLRIMWSCIRWDDMANKPPINGINTITTESEVITTELLKRRDLPPFGLRSEYLVRKIVVPLDYENEKDYDNDWKDNSRASRDVAAPAWKREGLRERKKKIDLEAEAKRQGPSVTEQWTIEEELQLWEIKGFGDKLEKQQQMIKDKEKERIQKENLERTRRTREENARKLAEERRKQLEANRANQIKNNILSGQVSEGYAMIRTVVGQTYRVPLSTLQGKKVGEQIAIKLSNSSGQPTTTTATIIQTVPPTLIKSDVHQPLPNATTAGSVRANGIASSATATGISSSSLVPQAGQKFQIIRPAAPQTITHTIKVSINGTVPLAANAMFQIPIRLPDNRIQMLQLPASMLNANRPIQITIPPTANSPTTQIIQLIITSTTLPVDLPAANTAMSQTPAAVPSDLTITQDLNSTVKVASSSTEMKSDSMSNEEQPLPDTISETNIGLETELTDQKMNATSPKQPELDAAIESEPTTSESIDNSSITSVTPNSTLTASSMTTATTETTTLLQHQPFGEIPVKSNNEESKFEVTPQLANSIVAAALESKSNTPEVQQKLLAMQQKSQLTQQQKNGNVETSSSTACATSLSTSASSSTNVDKKSSNVVSRGIGRSRTIRGNLVMNSNSSSSVVQNTLLSSEDRDQLAIKTLMKAVLDKLEKDDKLETRRKKSRENQLLTKWRQHVSRSNAKLQSHTDTVRKEMLRRRALLQQDDRSSTNESLDSDLPDASQSSDSSADDATSDFLKGNDQNQACFVSNGQIANSANPPFGSSSRSGADGTQNEEPEGVDNQESGGACNNNAPIQSNRHQQQQQPCVNNHSSSNNNDNINSDSNTDSVVNVDSANDLRDNYDHKHKAHESQRVSESPSTPDRTAERATLSRVASSSKRSSPCEPSVSGKRVRTLSQGKATMSDNGNASVFSTNEDSSASVDRQSSKSRKLYCICRQPYDSKRFMVGCDYCHNWFHCDCLQVEEDLVKRLDSFVCAQCRIEYADELDEEQLQLVLPPLNIDTGKKSRSFDAPSNRDVSVISPKPKRIPETVVKKETGTTTPANRRNVKKSNTNSARKTSNKQQLYCICQKPYNESQFYVQCEQCSEWLHGRCVGVLCKEAEQIDVYLCPQCDPNSTINYANQKQLDSTDFSELRKLLKQIQQHKNAWPFLRPVDERQVPDYYEIITEPMDLATIEGKLNKQAYDSLTFFIGDVTKIFDNCRYYNDKRSAITHCADLLENFFVQKIKCLRQNMIGR